MKKNIEEVQGSGVYPASLQMLIHQGKVLKDETTLEENKVAENSFVVLMLSKVIFCLAKWISPSQVIFTVHYVNRLLFLYAYVRCMVVHIKTYITEENLCSHWMCLHFQYVMPLRGLHVLNQHKQTIIELQLIASAFCKFCRQRLHPVDQLHLLHHQIQ